MHAVLAALLAAAPAAPAAPASPPDPLAQIEQMQQELFTRLAPSVVFITNKAGFGSGFYVSRDGLVLTNAHVVGTNNVVDVVTHDGRRLAATVVEKAKNADLALVQVPVGQSQPFALADADGLRVGAWVGAIGHPRGGIWTFTTGMVSNIYPIAAERPVFQTQIPLSPGSSGGPIFDRHGRVVGVVTASLTDAQLMNFGIKIDVALRELKALPGRCECLVVSAPDKVPVFIDGVMRGLGPRVVLPVAAGSHEVVAVIGDKRRRVVLDFPTQRAVTLEAAAP